jgi:glutaredoxin
MSNYSIHAVILKGCPYSSNAYELLKNKTNIKIKYTYVNYENKDNYKTKDIDTFPQIYLEKKNSNGSLLIGGYNELKNIFDLFYKEKYSSDKINNYIENNKKLPKKSLLRFIELINL